MILSVSRRTDIPAFYPKWFVNRVREGFVYVRNPFNANQISRIPLSEDVVDCIVFWSKNPEPIMEYLPEISKKYHDAFYFQYTINAYGHDMEPAIPELHMRIDSFKKLSDTYGPERVVWRYDPILLGEGYSLAWHQRWFEIVFGELRHYTDTCVISFIDMYEKTIKNAKPYNISAPAAEEIDALAAAFSSVVKGSGLRIKTCAEGVDLNRYGIEPNRCIDQARIERIIGCPIKAKPDRQRDNCRCIECADIGLYNTCLHGCRYCYANYSMSQVRQAVAAHDDNSPLLTGTLTSSSVIKDYSKAKTLKTHLPDDGQMRLFQPIRNL